MARDNWTEEQITVVLYEYCRNPFGQFSATKQFVKDWRSYLVVPRVRLFVRLVISPALTHK